MRQGSMNIKWVHWTVSNGSRRMCPNVPQHLHADNMCGEACIYVVYNWSHILLSNASHKSMVMMQKSDKICLWMLGCEVVGQKFTLVC